MVCVCGVYQLAVDPPFSGVLFYVLVLCCLGFLTIGPALRSSAGAVRGPTSLQYYRRSAAGCARVRRYLRLLSPRVWLVHVCREWCRLVVRVALV